ADPAEGRERQAAADQDRWRCPGAAGDQRPGQGGPGPVVARRPADPRRETGGGFLFRRALDGQAEPEDRAGAGGRADADLAAVATHELAHDVEAKAESVVALVEPLGGPRGAEEAIEDAGLIL